MFDILKKIFGTKHDKDVKAMWPVVEECNKYFDEFESLTDDELRAKSEEFKIIIKASVQAQEAEKAEIQDRLKNDALNVDDTLDARDRLKILDKEIYQGINDTLDDLLPQAFAVVKQVCKRLAEAQHRYEVSGQMVTWDMVPYDVQLMGGIVLHRGKISEMATGEGKTLVATLPMYLNALAGKGVHLVTVNDYLAKRDSDWMSPIYEFLGVSVGSIQSNMENDDRQKMYHCDITYGTNNEFGFDYLRDNMVTSAEQMVQRPHWYAIVDEVDSVLVDEARTPLIISGPVGHASDQKFEEMNPRVRRLVDAQSKFVNQFLNEASKFVGSENKEDKEKLGIALLRAYRGLPKHNKLSKLLQEPENLRLMKDTELFYMRDQGIRMQEIDDELFYNIDEKNHQIDITEKGRNLICSAQEDPEMFIIPDIGTEMSQLDNIPDLAPEEKQRRIDEMNILYAERSDRIHTITQLLRAYSLYEIDVEYVVQDSKVLIVDEFTGRILDGRRYSEGLHQAIEAKENVTVERDTQTLATITLQNYFRLYKKLAGMTGTADTEAAEFENIYKLDVTVIPTNRPAIREDRDDLIYKTKREKYNAIADEIEKEVKNNRAVLCGTTSVEVSELLSKMLSRKKITHNVLNAKQHAREAEIVAHAGRKGSVTIATNMAGRGTDIKLDHEVRKNGGLAIIGTERHDARRIDRQLRGRAGRQGDPGSSQFYISLEDDLMRLFGGERIANVMGRLKIPEGEAIQHAMISKNVERAQKKVEENNFGIRKRLLEYDNVMNQQREVIYSRRKNALMGERLKGELFEYVEDLATEWYDDLHKDLKLKELKNSCRAIFLCEPNITDDDFEKLKDDVIIKRIVDAADDFYKRKEEMLGTEFMGNLERYAVLQTIDEKWREHLREMDDLKEGIHLRSYGQKDPLLEYKSEAYKLFVELVKDINKEAVLFAFKYFPQVQERQVRTTGAGRRPSYDGVPRVRSNVTNSGALRFTHSSQVPAYVTAGAGQQQQGAADDEGVQIRTFRKSEPTVGRNDPCPCGSGKKYKQCHGRVGMN